MHRLTSSTRLLVFTAVLLALVPLARMAYDWVEVARVLGVPSQAGTARGFDWVVWEEDDGLILADYVFSEGPETLRRGDVFFQLDYQQYFNVEDLERAIEGVPPGSVRTYFVLRDEAMVEVDVLFTRYPVFLYPLSAPLWTFSVWGFLVGIFLHVVGLIIAAPLALRSRPARFSLALIAVSSLWMVGNGLRMLLVEVVGPLPPGSTSDGVFQALTLIGLAGWIGFPALLLHKVVADVRRLGEAQRGLLPLVLYLPPVLLALGALVATVAGSLGPLTLDSLAAPILFYACCYIGTAAALVLALTVLRPQDAEDHIGRWSPAGSALMFVVALLMGLSVLGIVPLFGIVNDATAGWLVVGAQLLSVVPVVLVAHATLKHGMIDRVVSRAVTYLLVLGLFFLTFVGGLTLLDPLLDALQAPRLVLEGLYVVLLLVVFDRAVRRLRVAAETFFATDRQRARQHLARFQERMRALLDFDELTQETVDVVGQAFGVRSARLFLRPGGVAGPWIAGAYHPEPPFFTERVLTMVWPHLQREGAIWARNSELNESTLPADLAALMVQRQAVLAVPIQGDGGAVGLLVLGEKQQRRAVYNLEDIDLLRSLSGQLGLAVERLQLVERERALVRESAEAQLVALRAQINPHFLFNALNTIVSLIEEQPADAVVVVEHLATIFRHILQTGGQAFVSVQEEFGLVSHYLSIEQARFGDRLQVERRLDPDLASTPVPAFAVQTLVENAVKHGLEQRREGGTLRIECRPGPEDLTEIRVTDTGVGIPSLFGRSEQHVPADTDFLGIGLRNVAARLEQLYGRTDLLRMHSDAEGGTTVRLLLPPAPRANAPTHDASVPIPAD